MTTTPDERAALEEAVPLVNFPPAGKAYHDGPLRVSVRPDGCGSPAAVRQEGTRVLIPWVLAGPDDAVYVHEEGCCVYTRGDFTRLIAEFAAEHGLPTAGYDELLYFAVDWQHPETILDEERTEPGLWSEEEWDAARARKEVSDAPEPAAGL